MGLAWGTCISHLAWALSIALLLPCSCPSSPALPCSWPPGPPTTMPSGPSSVTHRRPNSTSEKAPVSGHSFTHSYTIASDKAPVSDQRFSLYLVVLRLELDCAWLGCAAPDCAVHYTLQLTWSALAALPNQIKVALLPLPRLHVCDSKLNLPWALTYHMLQALYTMYVCTDVRVQMPCAHSSIFISISVAPNIQS